MDYLKDIASVIGSVGAILASMAWGVHTVRHRRHLSRRVDDLQRFQRLTRRLGGVVNDMERILDHLEPPVSDEEVPEELASHVRYLFSLRREAQDNAAELGRHAAQLRWTDGHLSSKSLAGKRCELAHGSLIKAFHSLAQASREYERGLRGALKACGDGAEARPLSAPVRLLDEDGAAEVARLRDDCGSALTETADALRLPFRSHVAFETTWPVRRSEILPEGVDPYDGEIKPMGWGGLGPEPLLHVDAR